MTQIPFRVKGIFSYQTEKPQNLAQCQPPPNHQQDEKNPPPWEVGFAQFMLRKA
jgi:hypothetical protein